MHDGDRVEVGHLDLELVPRLAVLDGEAVDPRGERVIPSGPVAWGRCSVDPEPWVFDVSERERLPAAGVRGVAVGRAGQLVQEQVEHQQDTALRPLARPVAGFVPGGEGDGGPGVAAGNRWSGAGFVDSGGDRSLVEPKGRDRAHRESTEERGEAHGEQDGPDDAPDSGVSVHQDATEDERRPGAYRQ
ncbi:hypothetical protein [Glycomyces sp. NRRL B-16210]|uniref:hypothetical protein n=1 Tax=Glycomyces sp. NRRL B-16210 TaxID=1463821 RepID=UPI00105BE258|nr:hypothetical protein [Glycomyces sp. NRRL B-16210]